MHIFKEHPAPDKSQFDHRPAPRRTLDVHFNRLGAELGMAGDERGSIAQQQLVRGGFRHIIVVDGADVVGILSMRDIVRCWTAEGATAELASGAGLK